MGAYQIVATVIRNVAGGTSASADGATADWCPTSQRLFGMNPLIRSHENINHFYAPFAV